MGGGGGGGGGITISRNTKGVLVSSHAWLVHLIKIMVHSPVL